MLKALIFLIGFGFLTIGFSSIILYINLFAFGYNFKEYISLITKLPEFYYIIIGFILVNISILKKEKKNDR